MAVLHLIMLVLQVWALTNGALGALCPGGEWTCATGMTCCMLPSGHEGCCPYENATCCADKVHCCPMGSVCSAKGGGHCQSDLSSKVAKVKKVKQAVNFVLKSSHTSVETIPTNGMCHDGSTCKSSATCCPIKDGSYGCCPFPGAVCCPNEQSCCPHNTVCDSDGFCVVAQVKLKFENSTLSGVSIECPGEGSQCPDNNTCCSLGSGKWGCCPMPKAVCCADKEHCCPNGYRCAGSSKTCVKE